MVDVSYLNELRRVEMETVLPMLPPGSRILEFGSGTGEQARFLADHGFDVIAIDLANSDYSEKRVFPVEDYDGHHIPLGDKSVDVIFSSNVLEHIENFDEISAEFRRILKSDGFAIHAMPTSSWRLWTFGTGVPKSLKAAAELPGHLLRRAPDGNKRAVLVRELRRIASGLVPIGHGTSVEGISELWTFSRFPWRRKFRRAGFEVIDEKPIGLFYTGHALFGDGLPFPNRRKLSRLFGSASRVYVVKPRVR